MELCHGGIPFRGLRGGTNSDLVTETDDGRIESRGVLGVVLDADAEDLSVPLACLRRDVREEARREQEEQRREDERACEQAEPG
jgi:hypothetical protein